MSGVLLRQPEARLHAADRRAAFALADGDEEKRRRRAPPIVPRGDDHDADRPGVVITLAADPGDRSVDAYDGIGSWSRVYDNNAVGARGAPAVRQ
jgi:hypothetical protein